MPNIENAVEDEHFAWLLVTAESKQEYDSSCIAASAILGGEEDEFWRVSVGEYGQDEPLLELRFDASYRLCELKYLRKGIHISGTGAEAFKSLLTGAMPSILVDDAEVDLAGSKIYLNVMGLLSTRRISWYGSLGWKPLPCRAISRTDGRPAITHDPSVYTGVLEYFHGLSWDGLLNQMFGDKRVKIQELKNLAEKYPLNSEDSAVVRFSDVWTALCDANRKVLECLRGKGLP
ncbi:MAG: hypothetical protein KDK78_08745 [Chlamydiia bacterium]|nr:hypothetical protein [Chlamydiia bacterium]